MDAPQLSQNQQIGWRQNCMIDPFGNSYQDEILLDQYATVLRMHLVLLLGMRSSKLRTVSWKGLLAIVLVAFQVKLLKAVISLKAFLEWILKIVVAKLKKSFLTTVSIAINLLLAISFLELLAIEKPRLLAASFTFQATSSTPLATSSSRATTSTPQAKSFLATSFLATSTSLATSSSFLECRFVRHWPPIVLALQALTLHICWRLSYLLLPLEEILIWDSIWVTQLRVLLQLQLERFKSSLVRPRLDCPMQPLRHLHWRQALPLIQPQRQQTSASCPVQIQYGSLFPHEITWSFRCRFQLAYLDHIQWLLHQLAFFPPPHLT